MSDNKNIDRIFQEKFKDYEVFPEPNVWKGIENELAKKRKRRIIPLWLRLAGAAAILLLLIPTGYWFYNMNTTKPEVPDANIITNTDYNDNSIKENESSETEINSEENTNDENFKKVQVKENLITTIKQSNQKDTSNKKANIVPKNEVTNNIVNNNDGIASQQKSVELQEVKAINQLKNIEQQQDIQETEVAILEKIEEDQYKKDNFLEEIEKQKTLENVVDVNDKKWSIGSTIGPVYLNSSSKGSPIDPSLANNTKSSNNSISYGLKVNYKISDKFSLQSGIQNIDLGYSTENVSVIASSALLDQSKTNINSDVGATLEVSSTASQNSETFSQRSPFDSNGSLDQSFSYVEVPLEAKYAIVQKKLGVNLVGGFSTYFLYDNDVSITTFGKKSSLGEASNLNDLNFSGNVGLDLNYNLSPNLFINASPMLKYQLNTFSENSGGFKPYFFGIYGGLNFRF